MHTAIGQVIDYAHRLDTGGRSIRRLIAVESGPVALCVLTDKNADVRWTPDNAAQVLIGKIAKEVYEHFGEKK